MGLVAVRAALGVVADSGLVAVTAALKKHQASEAAAVQAAGTDYRLAEIGEHFEPEAAMLRLLH